MMSKVIEAKRSSPHPVGTTWIIFAASLSLSWIARSLCITIWLLPIVALAPVAVFAAVESARLRIVTRKERQALQARFDAEDVELFGSPLSSLKL